MGPSAYTLLTHIHGHAAWLSLVLLLHPILWLRGGRPISRRVRWTARFGTALLVGVYSLGLWIYPAYRSHVKPGLVFENGRPGPLLELALRFESKEHIALLAVVLAVAGLAAIEAGSVGRTAARVLLAGAVGCGAFVAGLGLTVAMGAHPGW